MPTIPHLPLNIERRIAADIGCDCRLVRSTFIGETRQRRTLKREAVARALKQAGYAPVPESPASNPESRT